MGGSNVKVLLEDSSVDFLVHDNTNGSLGDVENNTGTAVVVSVGHALVDGGVHLDINIVASLLLQ